MSFEKELDENLKAMLSEKDKEIAELKAVISDLSAQTTAFSPNIDRNAEYITQYYEENLKDSDDIEAIKKKYESDLHQMVWHKGIYEAERKELKKLQERISNLEMEVSYLTLQLTKEPDTSDIPDDELEDFGHWFDGKYGEEYHELIKRLHRCEAFSERRRLKIIELKKELAKEQSRKYDIYVEEDKLTYLQLEKECDRLNLELERCEERYDRQSAYIERLEQMLRQYTDAEDITDAVMIASDQISQRNELKKATQKKQGRPSGLDDRKLALILELHSKGHSQREIASQVGYSPANINKILKQYKDKG